MQDKITEKLNVKSAQLTKVLLLIAVFLWLIWIAFDAFFAPETAALFLPIRIFFSLFSLLVWWILKKDKMGQLLAQYCFFIPPLATVAYMFNVVPESALFIYFLGATMVLIVGFVALIIPPKHAVVYGLVALGLIPLFYLILGRNSLEALMANGGFVYLSLCLFGVGLAIVRYRSVVASVTNEILLAESNQKLKQQSEALEISNHKLQDSLKEREVLLKEVHHRVKNNLQIISSLVKLQEDQIDQKSAHEILQLCQDRIQSMAIIHECLYQTDDFEFLDFENYCNTLSRYLANTYDLESKSIKIKVDIQEKDLDMIQIVPCGLIINEAVTNAIKHAFDEQGGTISIAAKAENNMFLLTISDDGKGFDPENDRLKVSLGIRLIKGLGQQLKGKSQVSSTASGTTVEVKFKHEKS